MRTTSLFWLVSILAPLACDSDAPSDSDVPAPDAGALGTTDDDSPGNEPEPSSSEPESGSGAEPEPDADDDEPLHSDDDASEPEPSTPEPGPVGAEPSVEPEPSSSEPEPAPEPTFMPEPAPVSPDPSEPEPSPVLPNDGEVRAFPGATGFGALATGGRGGQVIHVTTLDATGPGSLQAALSASGPRIVVFDVSGVIEADILEIENGDVTIAGQSAPGGGITIKGRLFAAYNDSVGNIVLRHVRIRPEYDGGDGAQFDAIQFSLNHTVMIDHVSVGFGIDETIDLYSAQNVTVQWSTIESPTPEPSHEGGGHNYGLINGPDGRYASVHHNLFAHSRNRNPAIANGPAEVLNNVMYNVRHGFVHHNPASGSFNLVGNYFKAGVDDTLIPFFFDDENDSGSSDLGYYVADNWVEGEDSECAPGELDDPWEQCENDLYRDASFRVDEPFDFTSVEGYRSTPASAAGDAYTEVLARAGAFPRDVVTLQSVADAEAGTGSWGMPLPADLMQGLTPTDPPTDADRDGMADEWESSRGLDPSDGDDHTERMESGYTAIEEYLNELAERLIQ